MWSGLLKYIPQKKGATGRLTSVVNVDQNNGLPTVAVNSFTGAKVPGRGASILVDTDAEIIDLSRNKMRDKHVRGKLLYSKSIKT